MTKIRPGRGGARTPARPKATSLPQSGDRTDGGAGSSKQPLRDMPGLPYGQQGQLNEQIAATGGLPRVNNLPNRMNQEAGTRPEVFGATERFSEEATAGGVLGAGYSPLPQVDSLDVSLMAMFEVSRSPVILDLINRRNKDA